jgi:hypothetical protein
VNAPEGPFYRPLIWSLSFVLCALGVLLAIEMVASVIGPFRLGELGSRDPRGRVALWLGAPLRGDAAVPARWRGWLTGPTELRAASTLATLDPGEVGAVLLSEPRTLGAEDVESLERYLAAGGGVVITGSLGVRDREGSWRGYDLMRKLLGGAEVAPVGKDGTHGLVAAHRGPLSAPLAPAQPIAVQAEDGLPGIADGDAELRWEATGGEEAPAAALRRSFGRGRLVWLAVGPERGAPGERGELPLAAVLESALAWVARRPTVEILPWPSGAAFAAVLEPQPERAATLAPARATFARELEAGAAAASVAWLSLPGASSGETHALAVDLLAEAQRQGAWVATRAELSSWIRSRSSLEATLRHAGPQRLAVAITNHAPRPTRDVVLRVHLNRRAVRATAEPTALLQARPGVRFRQGDEVIDLVLPELAARRSAAFSVDYEPLGES